MRGLTPRSMAIFAAWRIVLVSFVYGVNGLLVALMPRISLEVVEGRDAELEVKEVTSSVHRCLDCAFTPQHNNQVLVLSSL